MVKALFDTNILIDYLNQESKAKKELSLYSNHLISIITWMEVLVGIKEEDLPKVKNWLSSQFELVSIDEEISDKAVTIRKAKKVKLPDAIIQASAEQHNALLVTRNTKDFSSDDPMIRVPYQF